MFDGVYCLIYNSVFISSTILLFLSKYKNWFKNEYIIINII